MQDDDSFSGSIAQIKASADENITTTAHGSTLRFLTTDQGTTTLDERMRIDHNSNVGIGMTNPLAQLHIQTSGSAIKGLIVKGSASQSANLAEWLSSADAVLAKITPTGSALFGDKVMFTQTDGDEAIDSLNDGYLDYLATTAHRFNNPLFISNIKSGATQGGAGASVSEIWRTSGHATLPDGVLMIGI